MDENEDPDDRNGDLGWVLIVIGVLVAVAAANDPFSEWAIRATTGAQIGGPLLIAGAVLVRRR